MLTGRFPGSGGQMSVRSTRFALRRAIGAGAALVVVLAAFAPAAQAAQPGPTTSPNVTSPNVTSLRAELRDGSLLATHGVRNVCAAAKAHCLAQVVTSATGSTTALSTTTPLGYGPADFANAYHLPAATVGATGTVAIIDAGAYPNLESDLAVYRAQFGLPACTTANGCLTITDLHGGPPLTPDPTLFGQFEEENVAVETALDMQLASAACPGCKLLELQIPVGDGFTNSDASMADFGTAVNTAARLGAGAVSMSYQYTSDPNVETGQAGRDLFHPGMAVMASSGDGGFEGNQHTGWPQNLPWVTSVGGTSLFATNTAGTTFSQTAWSGAGSGCETDLPAAIGEPATVSAFCAGHRSGSDISADADPATGPAVYDTYAPFSGQPLNWFVVGGTSASSPFIAGLYVRGGHLSQVIGPNTLYTAPKKDFIDVKLGQNAPTNGCQSVSAPVQLCQSGTGWDGPTGLGTPNGLAAF
jgi:subtilase family serine protease